MKIIREEKNQKLYYLQDGIGTAKYTVNSYDGESTHKDGSPFYDIHIFSNKIKRDNFVKELNKEGYKEK